VMLKEGAGLMGGVSSVVIEGDIRLLVRTVPRSIIVGRLRTQVFQSGGVQNGRARAVYNTEGRVRRSGAVGQEARSERNGVLDQR
jgi:hypothetical protein